VTPAITRGPAAVVGGWTVAGHAGWVWLHQAWPAADGDLTPAAAETLAAALLWAAVEARRPPDRSWTPEQPKEMTAMAASNQPNGSVGGSLHARRERERLAVELRVEGCTYAEIGAHLGVSDRMASRIFHRAMDRVLREPVAQLVELEASRLDGLWAAMWPRALAGSARHAEVCVRISERRSRLLGLDQPTRVNANVLANVTVDQIDAEIERLLRECGGDARSQPS
jgi:hypothetical protein